MSEEALPAQTKRKLHVLLVALKDTHERNTAIIDEINELLGGGVGIAAKVKDVQRAFQETWTQRYHGTYIWRHAIDVPHIKRLVKMLGVEETQARIHTYIRTDDPFLDRQRHPFGLFVSGVNTYSGAGTPAPDLELAAPPVGCKHSPLCASDDAHTRRTSREMRA